MLATAALVAGLLAVASASPSAAAGPIIYVDIAAAGANDGSSWADAFTDLQDALAVATAGDEIRVAEGTYRPHTSDRTVSFDLVDGVDLIGGYATGGAAGPDPDLYPTVLSGDLNADDLPGFVNSGENSYHVVEAGEAVGSAVLDGLVITGGNADGTSRDAWGAAVHLWRADGISIRNSTIVANSAVGNGGGISVEEGSYSLESVRIYSNTAANSGGAIYDVGSNGSSFLGAVIAGNVSGAAGGGLSFQATSPVIRDSWIVNNTAAAYGGGLMNHNRASPLILNTVISGNSTSADTIGWNGGGIYNSSRSSPTIVNSFVGNNFAHGGGGGIYSRNQSNARIINSVVANNHATTVGGGVFADSLSGIGADIEILGSVVAANESSGDSGVYVDVNSSVNIANSILWDNTSTSGGTIGPGAATVNYSDVEGWTGGGVGNIDLDPQFVGPGNYRLQGTSPAREVGDNSAVPPDAYDVDGDGDTTEPTPDLDGRDRISGIVDMGAYEMPLPKLRAGGGVANPEGDLGDSQIITVPITLSAPQPVPVTVDWVTLDVPTHPDVAHPGSDYVGASGTLTFEPGETVQNIPIEVLGDLEDEPGVLWGAEWGFVQLSNPSFATIDIGSGLWGLSIFAIVDDDPKVVESVYWTGLDHGRNVSALDPDTGISTDLVTFTTDESPSDIEIDQTTGKVYFTTISTTPGAGGVYRMDLDGTGLERLVDGNQIDGLALDPSNGKLYWTDQSLGTVNSANFDGSDAAVIVSVAELPTLGQPFDIAVDPITGSLWFSDFGDANSIYRAALDGSNLTPIITGLLGPTGVEVDPIEEKIYFTQEAMPQIEKANFDGSEVETVLVGAPAGTNMPRFLSIDLHGQQLYWADQESGELWRSGLDGGSALVLLDELPSPRGVALLMAPA